jgi:hypothetical protein
MPTTKELTIQIEDRPGTLGKICRALADKGVNIVAFQASQSPGNNLIRFVVDNPTAAEKVLDTEQVNFTENEVAQIRLPNRSGELARAASQLGDAKININYAYCGVDPTTTAPVVIFGVKEAGQAAKILDRIAAAA